MLAYTDARDRIEVAFTDRHGGVSGGPYASLNLAAHTHDDRDAVAENLRRAVTAFGGAGAAARTVCMTQVHGAEVHVVDRVLDEPPVGDALVTAVPGLVLVVRVADCVPVLLADPAVGVVGAAHAGRAGLAAGVVPATVAAMRGLGATDLVAWVGPSVCGACYEVPEEMRADVAGQVPEAWAETSWGTPALDIGAGVRAQLRASGVPASVTERCTVEDEDLFSHRRQGAASGRFAGLVRVRP